LSEQLLRIANLAVSYGAAQVLSDVSLEVAPRQIVGLVGRNGAGKTTTLKTVSGLVQARHGRIEFEGEALPSRPELVARRGVIHVPEGRGLMPNLTARQNLRLGAYAVGRDFGPDDTRQTLELFPMIEASLDRPAGLLSGGQQQMVAIARGLAQGPRLLMIDELSLGLAPKIVKDLLALLVAIAQDRAIGLLLVDQNVRALAEVSDTIYHLEEGKAVLSDGKDEELLRTVYFGH
jgi:branched-chain amino acid transport system ATP-binding protein